MQSHQVRLSETMGSLKKVCEKENSTFGDLLVLVGVRGHAVLAFLLSLMFFIPLPMPGVSVLFGVVILLLGVQMAIGQPPWLPRALARKAIPQRFLLKVFDICEKGTKKMEWLIRPRGRFFLRRRGLWLFNGLMIAFGGLLLALPLPPGTNAPPAIGIALTAIGVLEEDLFALLAGYCVILIVAAAFILIGVLGVEGVEHLFHAWYRS